METKKSDDLAKVEPTQSERFALKVQKEFAGKTGSIELTKFQKRLIQNYFIATDMALKMAEDKRLKKGEQYQDKVPVAWPNVNMEMLAINVVACARIGYDPALPNQINVIPFKNNTTGKYDMVFVEGYRGKELKATKYGLNVPDDVIVELVYSTDKFQVVKKDRANQVEGYVFEITKPFERGTIVGGFYYHNFNTEQWRNKLVFFSIAEIEKRKPKYASVEFWGGEKDVWKDGKKAGKETTEGWYAEMCLKTVFRAAYNSITIDSQKIDEDFMRLMELEQKFTDALPEAERNERANTQDIDFTEVKDEPKPIEEKKPEPAPAQQEKKPEANQEQAGTTAKQGTITGPDF